MMQHPMEMFQAFLSASACVLFFLFQRYDTFKGWRLFKVLSLGMGLSAAIRFSGAFDPPHQISLRSLAVTLAGFVIAILLLIRWERTVKRAKSGAV